MNKPWMTGAALAVATAAFFSIASPAQAESNPQTTQRFVQIKASTKEERSQLATLGMSIEFVRSDSVWGFVSPSVLKRIEAEKISVMGNFDFEMGRGGHEGTFDFPNSDSKFHNYKETLAALQALNTAHPELTHLASIGKSLEGKDLWAFHINSSADALASGISNKPGVIFMGNHHAREHVSNEVPLMLIQYLLDHKADASIAALLDTRDIWIIPMVNPDGVEWDISAGNYKMWRKNRRNNGDGTYGVDLNRNYGFKWGTGGSDTDTSSDVYMGKQPFSEPETQVIRDFVEAHLNAKVLLTFHTFSELVLYPWGHTYDPVDNTKDRAVFETMAKTMAGWNHYTPEQSSALYIASGDTTDWAYGVHGIFAFTFELSPNSMMGGGFYPGQKILDKVFNDNLRPCLYLIDAADDPYKVTQTTPSGGLKNYVEPKENYGDFF